MFYVYVYRDPRPSKNNQPVYVGKGTGDRDLSHWSRGSHNKPLQDFLSHLRALGLQPTVSRVLVTEVEAEAFAKEIELIALFGRRSLKLGTLFNLTDGGEGGSGAVRSETDRKVTKFHATQNWKDPAYQAKVAEGQRRVQGTPEARAAKAVASTEAWATPETRERRQTGIKRARSTAESKAKTSTQAKAQWANPDYASKQTANNQEIANRVEVKAAKSAAVKALWADPVWRATMLAARAKKVAPTSAS